MIKLTNIEKKYGQFQVLKDVHLHVKKGEIYGLVGKNGAGKTTIFKIILGLTSYNGGQLDIAGHHVKSELQHQRRKIGFFIGKNFFDYLTAKENLDYYRELKGIKDSKEVDRVLELVGLQDVKSQYSSFSMGMKQRLGIANALLGNPEILILDEPVNGLDPQGIADVRRLIVKLNQEKNMTIIISSHILSELEHTATRFGIIDQGRLLKEIDYNDLKVKKNTVEISVDDLKKAKAVLNENHISIIQETSRYKSLEDYYFELIGGSADE